MDPREESLSELQLPNPFMIKTHVLDRQIMRHKLAYHFEFAFVSAF
jgi:hypothetical protein